MKIDDIFNEDYWLASSVNQIGIADHYSIY